MSYFGYCSADCGDEFFHINLRFRRSACDTECLCLISFLSGYWQRESSDTVCQAVCCRRRNWNWNSSVCNYVYIFIQLTNSWVSQIIWTHAVLLISLDLAYHAYRMLLYWLRVPERVKFKLCVLMHRCLTGAAPRYLTELAVPVASTARRRLRSVSSADLVVPSTRRSTIGDRAFAVAGPRAWNSLPSDIRTSTPSFDTFKKHLKCYLFQLSFSSL